MTKHSADTVTTQLVFITLVHVMLVHSELAMLLDTDDCYIYSQTIWHQPTLNIVNVS